MRPYRYVGRCVEDRDQLEYSRKRIAWATFWRHVPPSEVQTMEPFNLYSWGRCGDGLRIEHDCSVSVYRSFVRGRRCYYIDDSLIEYVFQVPDPVEKEAK